MFTPILPGSSLSSWIYLQDSKEEQLAVFGQDATINREKAHFAEKIAGMSSVDDLMNDYQALKVVLGAHGLQDDIQNRYFVQQVIEQGTSSEDSFANRLSDARYTALAQTFEELGLTGTGNLRDSLPDVSVDLADAITDQFGDSPLYLGLASRLSGNLTLGLLGADTSDKIWGRAVDDPALNSVFTKVLGTHGNVSSLSDSEQVSIFREATEFLFGNSSLSTLVDPDNTFAVADAYLGTSGQTLEVGFSYGGIRDRFANITNTIHQGNTTPVGSETVDEAVEAARWAALQADTTLRDVLASAVGVSAGFSSLAAADQIAELQSKTTELFGRSDFDLFSATANLTTIGDSYLNPDEQPLTHVFSLGGFTEQISAVRDADVGNGARWEAALSISANRTVFLEAYGLEESLADADDATLIAALKAETLRRFGTEDVAIFESAEQMAALTGLYMDAQVGDITNDYLEQEFRVAVGEERPELRIAMAIAEELESAVATGGTENGQWYRVLGSDVLRSAFETAFGLGSEFAGVDLDLQVGTMRDRSYGLIGSETVDGYLDPENQEKFISRYLVQAGTTDSTSSDASVSLFGEASASSILATLYSAG